MAQIKHPGTGLSLEWKTEDTAAAQESATILRQRLRDVEEDSERAEVIGNNEHMEWLTYETRYRLCLEQRPVLAAGSRGTNNIYIKYIIIVLLKLRSNSSNITQVLKSILTCAVHICRRSKIFG